MATTGTPTRGLDDTNRSRPISINSTSRSPGKLPPCPSCYRKMHIFSLKRTCSRCNISVCRSCASKKIVPGEIICRMCKGGIVQPTRLDLQGHNDGLEDDPYTQEEMEETQRQIIAKGYYACLTVRIIEAKGLIAGDESLLGEKLCSDPYCVLSLSQDNTSRQTSIIKRTLFPIWNEDFEIPVRAPFQTLHLELFDRDELTEDDSIGKAHINLTRLPSGATVTGWLPITFTEDTLAQSMKMAEGREPEKIPAGGIHISLRMDFKSQSELGAYIKQAISPPVYVQPKFDLNEAYAPLMICIDIIWWRALGPCIWSLLAVLFWTDVFVSAVWFVLWPFLCLYLEYWPSGGFFFIAAWMAWNKLQSTFARLSYAKKKKKTVAETDVSTAALTADEVALAKAKKRAREPSIAKKMIQNLGLISKHKPRLAGQLEHDLNLEEDHSHDPGSKDFEDQTLGSVITTIASVIPKWLKDIVASWQTTLRWLSQLLIMITEIFRGDHALSFLTFVILLALGVILLFVPFKLFMASVGVIIMIALSPVCFLLIGVITYFTRAKSTAELSEYDMKKEFVSNWSSEEAQRQFDKAIAYSVQSACNSNSSSSSSSGTGSTGSSGSGGKGMLTTRQRHPPRSALPVPADANRIQAK